MYMIYYFKTPDIPQNVVNYKLLTFSPNLVGSSCGKVLKFHLNGIILHKPQILAHPHTLTVKVLKL